MAACKSIELTAIYSGSNIEHYMILCRTTHVHSHTSTVVPITRIQSARKRHLSHCIYESQKVTLELIMLISTEKIIEDTDVE